ncbi:MAG: 4Fe-4S dicluster domain-containing protein [Bacteroidetes bacterium]|nr:MAG: 4Fe-4S dicluster domain-containing protein [Bacteroidota bacterium]
MKAILTDITKCIGCNECVKACKVTNNLPPDKPREWQKTDGLSASNWTSVLHNGKYNLRKQCRHCVEPACVSVCPVGALHKTETGAVVYDSDKCLGCRYCMMACPYGIPRYDWDEPVPYIKKCILCYHKIKDGTISQPACTSACPTGATIYGERDELLKEARQRINAEPDKYLDTIYGEKEVGGTNVLYITAKDCPLDFLLYYNNRIEKGKELAGMPDLNEAIPITTKWAMGAVPFAFLGMGALMSGIYWVINRRNKLQSENQKENQKQEDENG